jgi:hypothetical protein
MTIHWPDIKFPSINLWIIGSDHKRYNKECSKNKTNKTNKAARISTNICADFYIQRCRN